MTIEQLIQENAMLRQHIVDNQLAMPEEISTAQPAVSVATAIPAAAAPVNVWQQAVDAELASAHLGIAGNVTFMDAAKALNELICWHIEVATNPATNGGKVLAQATGGQAQDVGRDEVLVTVSGFTGSGKSAIAGEIEILCRALGLQVEWPDSDSEKHMTHADWIAALEQYKPRVRIVECNVPHSVVKGQDK